MRELLFRGKRVDNGEWVYGGIISDGKESPTIIDYSCKASCWEACFVEDIDPSTVGQYTGLKDKFGLKIFEGDVINDPVRIGYKIIVELTGFGWGWEYYHDHEQFEITGNIHDKDKK